MTHPTRGSGRSSSDRTFHASFWIDESGSRSTAGQCFVVAGIKTRRPDDLLRSIEGIREKHDYRDREFKFARLTMANQPVFYDLVDVLAASDAHLMAAVVDSSTPNPFKGEDVWRTHATINAQLVIGNINRNETATVLMDGISTPAGESLGRAVKRAINSRTASTPCIHAISLDSRCNSILQAADMVAGAIRYQRLERPGADRETPKALVAARLAAAFGLENLSDHRTRRSNIVTLKGPRARRPALASVRKASGGS